MPVIIDGTSGVTTPTYGGADTSEYLVPVTQFKNRIINGAMVIDQRNAGASVAGNANYSLDRWYAQSSVNGKYTVQQNAGSLTPVATTGFVNYLGVTSSSAYTVGASELFSIQQPIEGLNIADLAWGTASAKAVTLSFWVYSSLTGTFGGALNNSGNSRSYPFSYSIPIANTWTQISITIAGDTTGTWLTTNGIGIYLRFGLGCGSTYSGTAGSWSGSTYFSATGATSVVGTNGATFYITGVQLEVGSTATSFDYRPYTTELQLCQRYYYQHAKGTGVTFGLGANYSSAYMTSYVQFPVTMRATPTLSVATGTDFYQFYRNNAVDAMNLLKFGNGSAQGGELYNDTEISGTAGQAGFLVTNNASASIAFQIEL